MEAVDTTVKAVGYLACSKGNNVEVPLLMKSSSKFVCEALPPHDEL